MKVLVKPNYHKESVPLFFYPKIGSKLTCKEIYDGMKDKVDDGKPYSKKVKGKVIYKNMGEKWF